MLTHIRIKNFKRFEVLDVDLGKNVVLIGPNNSGKTTALQALSLWDIGLRRWNEKRKGKSLATQRQGVAINRRDLNAIPVPAANLLWRSLHVRNVQREAGRLRTQNIRIDITIEGVTLDESWECGLEFDYFNEEAFYCRPLRTTDEEQPKRMKIPDHAAKVRMAFLPPMSGLSDREFIKQPGEIGVLIGQGQTAQVLRNLCYRVCWQNDTTDKPSDDWLALTSYIERFFGTRLQPPVYIAERSEIIMEYEEQSGVHLDLSSTGRGLHQTLLLLAHLYANPETVLLLDEPDAHLEVLRQRQTYHLISEIAEEKGSQIIAASHSEIVLNEAASRGTVIAFIGKPHLMNDRGSQVRKALTELGWDQFSQAEQTGWVLYVEDATDVSILLAFARQLKHPAMEFLERPFVHYVTTNLPSKAREHFNGLREGKENLVGLAIFDRLDKELQSTGPLVEMMWQKREIENYFCSEDVLLAWAVHDLPYDLFSLSEKEKRKTAMQKAIAEVTHLLEIDEKLPWSAEVKASDEVLDRIFRLYFKEMGLPLIFRKANYHELVRFVPPEKLDSEISEKLDQIIAVAKKARPRNE